MRWLIPACRVRHESSKTILATSASLKPRPFFETSVRYQIPIFLSYSFEISAEASSAYIVDKKFVQIPYRDCRLRTKLLWLDTISLVFHDQRSSRAYYPE